jgi:6,7-dimethyl-8-ribityllumazine synthase
MRELKGVISAKGLRFCIIVSRFNEFLTHRLLEGALECLRRHEVEEEKVCVIHTPGSFEMPSVANIMAEKEEFDAIICLGAIIRGETPHFEYICAEVAKGVATVSLQKKVPVIFGVLTADTVEQAIDRAGAKHGNKGWNAALSAMEMAHLFLQIK